MIIEEIQNDKRNSITSDMHNFNVDLFYNFASFPKKRGLKMKPSKASLLYHATGIVLLIIAFSVSLLRDNDFVMMLGLSALCLFWIMGIEHDLYGKEA